MAAGIMLILGACGGGGGGEASSGNTNPFTPVSSTSTGSSGSTGSGSSTGGSSIGGGYDVCYSGGLPYYCDNAIDVPNYIDVNMPVNDDDTGPTPYYGFRMGEGVELEPNNLRSDATVISLPARQTQDEALGVEINGSLNVAGDGLDWFKFVPPRDSFYEIRLCEPGVTCGLETRPGRMDRSDASLFIRSHNNSLMENAEDNLINGNVQVFWLERGYAIYPAVNPQNANVSSYTLQIVQTNNVRPTPPPAPNPPILLSDETLTTESPTIDWLPPTEYDDGQHLGDMAGYVFYRSKYQGGPYDEAVTVDNPGLSSYTLATSPHEGRYIVMTTVNSAGIEGQHSNEILILESPDLPGDDGTIPEEMLVP